VGILLFAHLVGITVGFILLIPITSPEFLQNTAAISSQIRAAVFLLFATSALTIGISIYVFSVFREHSYRMALWLIAFSIIWFSMQAVDNQHILSMMSLSQQYVEGGGSNAEVFRILATAVRAERKWSHYTELLVIDVWFFLFYLIMFRFTLVPRALSGFALAMVLVHTVAIALPVLMGYTQVLMLAYSMALSYLVMGTWLVVKGFADRNV
jgi:hypothetical protein